MTTRNTRKNKGTHAHTYNADNTSNANPFDLGLGELLKPLTDIFEDAAEQFNLATQCKMRRFYLVRSVDTDPDHVSGTGNIASGVIFEDGTVVLRWSTQHKSTAIYANIEELLAIHGHGGKTVIKYIDVGSV